MQPFFDFDASAKEAFEAYKKVLQSVETMMHVEDTGSNMTEREVVYEQDKLKLYHYKPVVKRPMKVPTLIVYALINTPAMMDLQQDRSFIKNLVEGGTDLYLIEWGYPTADDKYITLSDYINGYITDVVDFILKKHNLKQLNILGVCQGGTFSLIYTALNQDKVKNLVTMVTPVDFADNDGLLYRWGKDLDVDRMVEAYGVIPGDFMHTGFLTLKPGSLMVNKYVDLVNDIDNLDSVNNFMRMEKWIFDSPDQAGYAFREFVNSFFRDNLLVKGEYKLDGETVNLKNITCPILNLIAERDHQVPNSSSLPLADHVGSEDVTTKVFPTGHIGLFVSGRSQREVAPLTVEWLKARSK